ncbi:MAG: acyl-CoA dehydrogenase [Flavobacteriales bacterium]|nr:acyl-CoA dehydrogenase [Flavobacteriales bacterium]NNK80323.1 acyl-CoA dehydrogenase [Flavobacteriales bacterium]
METAEEKKRLATGGSFLIEDTKPEEIFIPEDFGEEHNMIRQSCDDFVDQEVIPNLERIDAMEDGLMPSLLDKAGELGILGISVPEELGGMGMDFKTTMLSTECLGHGFSFSVAHGAHTGIGTLPILYYGNEEQKKKYVPKLAAGEWKGAYCLTEPSSGSDANSGKTKAKLTEDGKHYLINGQKMWITNGGFADIFIVFAKIDEDENLTAFIVERGYEGISFNPEEKKMGIKGSSTRQVFFNDCKVPVENMLYEREKGFKIAVNVLNIGRIKLAGGVIGGSKSAITTSVKYANERNQFGRPISKYGAIRYKLAKQAYLTYAIESALYRATQDIDDAINERVESGMDKQEATIRGIAAYAPECAMLKVLGSECLDYCVDEGVQIHGGMGYSAESNIERAYRDSRINRIFEGTNEINRMLTVDMILKKAMKGELDLMTPAMAVQKELMSIPDFGDGNGELLAEEMKYIKNFKKAVLMTAGAAAQKLMMTLAKEQEILMNIADMTMAAYTAESVLLRVQKLLKTQSEDELKEKIAMARLYIYEASETIRKAGNEAIMSFAEGDEMRMMMMGIKRFSKIQPFNVKETQQIVAKAIIEANEYCF